MFLYFMLPAAAVFLFLMGIQKKRKDTHWETYRKSYEPVSIKQRAEADDIILSDLDLSQDKMMLAGLGGAVAGVTTVFVITGNAGLSLLGALMALLAPRIWATWKVNTRRRLFQNQLESSLNLMAAALRAGASEIQAWEQAALAAPVPARYVLEYVIRLHRSGRSLAISLEETARRTDSREVQMMAAATALCVQTGGNLAAVYDRLGETLREKQAFRSQTEAIVAEGQMSANVLAILPFGFIAFFRHMAPQYMAPLFDNTTGIFVFLVCSAMIIAGWVVLRKMSQIEY
jgi:tight adherence protein B